MSVNLPAGRDTAVLIVGAGPTGLTLALELARRHIPVRIIDAQDGPSSSSRALGIHARTLETFGHLSVLDRVLTAARMVNRFEVFANGSRQTSFGFDFTGLGYRLDGSAFLGQAQTESILRERLAEFNVSVEWGCELHTLHQDDTKVTTRLRSNGREHELCADWLIGADGGHSRVRKQLHLTFDGAGGETWLVADATLDGANLPANAIVMNRHSDGNLLLFPFPEPSRWRILETQVPPADTSLDQIRRSFERRLRSALGQPALQVTNVTWSSRFTIQQRQAARLRIGRCFLAGDAAHVHSPASGQGMNTGIQDAFNLGWKLALVISGAASERLLDSYESERRPVSAALLRSAQLATRLIQSRSGLLYHGLGLLLRLQALIAPLHRRIERGITRGMSALSIRYGEMPKDMHNLAGTRFLGLPRTVWDTPEARTLEAWVQRPGVKLLLAGTGAEVLARDLHPQLSKLCDVALLGAAAHGVTSLADTTESLRACFGAGGDATAWLIRPDGYLHGRYTHPTETQIALALADLLGQTMPTTTSREMVRP